METLDKIALTCLTIVVSLSILATSVYHINDRALMSKNIETAIAKGIDPISVRCSYADKNDNICVAFASRVPEIVIQSNQIKK